MNHSFFALALVALASVTASAEPLPIIVKCIVGTGKEQIVIGPSATPVKFSKTDTLRFATTWDPPTWGKTLDGVTTVVPMIPTSFGVEKAGWTLRCSADTTDKLIRLSGTFTFSAPEMTQGVFGERSGPLYTNEKRKTLLSVNKSNTVAIHSSSFPFQLLAAPGKEYEFKIRRLDKWVPCRMTCWYGKP